MNKKIIAFIAFAVHLSLFCGGGGEVLFAQKILKDTTFVIVKQFQPTIADAYKINDMPVVKDSVPPAPQLNYAIHSKKVFTPFTVEPLKPAKMVGEPLTKLYQSLAKVGAGNYLYGEGFFNNLRSKDISYGAHVKHLSWGGTLDGYGFSGFSDNQVELYGKKFFRKHTLNGNLDYNRNVIHYYNYDTSFIKKLEDNDLIKQRYSIVGGNISLQSHYTDSVHANYLLKLKYYNLSDFYSTSENNIRAEGDFSGFYEKQLVQVPVIIDYYNNKFSADTSNSVLIGLSPYITSSGDKWSTRIGIGIAIEGNQNDKSRFLFYPNIDFNYNVVENIIVPYAGFTGGLKKNSLKSLTDENPFLVPNPSLKNTNTKWEMYGGLRGSITKNISYNTRTSYRKAEDMYFFVNDNSDFILKGFNALYDDATIWNIHGELQFQYTEKIKLLAKSDYNKYTMTNELKPWHRPAMQFTLSANYSLKNKIIVNADVFVTGKRFAKATSNNGNIIVIVPKELPSIIDANLSLEYRYSKKLSFFLNMNNLGFSRYYLWNNYPSQSFNFLAGVTMSF
ncbi:MAG: hypothetical protein HY841_00275 [Bacteroidetes bacterium]|nr:hypothetical protein [Bacteroidota bacterium]